MEAGSRSNTHNPRFGFSRLKKNVKQTTQLAFQKLPRYNTSMKYFTSGYVFFRRIHHHESQFHVGLQTKLKLFAILE